MKELNKPEEDPLNLEEYQETINNIKTSRGKSILTPPVTSAIPSFFKR